MLFFFGPAIVATRSSALELARSNDLLSGKHVIWDGWKEILPCVSDLQREASGKFSSFRQKHLSIEVIDFFDMKRRLPLLTSSACESLQSFRSHLFCSRKGIYFVIKKSKSILSSFK